MRQVQAGAGRRRLRKKGCGDDDPSENYAPSHSAAARPAERSSGAAAATTATSWSDATGEPGQREAQTLQPSEPGGTIGAATSAAELLAGAEPHGFAEPRPSHAAQRAAAAGPPPAQQLQQQQQQWAQCAQQGLAALPEGPFGHGQPLKEGDPATSIGSLEAALLGPNSWVRVFSAPW